MTSRRGGKVRRATKILEKEDRGRHVLKVIVRMPKLDDMDARLGSQIIEKHVRNAAPPGSEVELTLRRHGDKTGNLLEGEAQAKRYSKQNKDRVDQARREEKT